MARAEGRRYCDPAVASYQESRMPEPIRLAPLTPHQMAVYEEFTRAVPGFAPSENPLPPQPPVLQMPPRSAQVRRVEGRGGPCACFRAEVCSQLLAGFSTLSAHLGD